MYQGVVINKDDLSACSDANLLSRLLNQSEKKSFLVCLFVFCKIKTPKNRHNNNCLIMSEGLSAAFFAKMLHGLCNLVTKLFQFRQTSSNLFRYLRLIT